MIETKKWLIGIGILFIVCLALSIWLFTVKTGADTANVYVDGVCVYSVRLDEISGPVEVRITGKNEITDTVFFDNGRVCIREAECPDQVCVHTGWISDSAMPIICLPARIIVRVEKAPALGIDSVSH
ncbi:MAG: NusG domain II-containing protein [Clostridia bacterium]|nr:NusG domain II-containing protein [Clostridia bacterium]